MDQLLQQHRAGHLKKLGKKKKDKEGKKGKKEGGAGKGIVRSGGWGLGFLCGICCIDEELSGGGDGGENRRCACVRAAKSEQVRIMPASH